MKKLVNLIEKHPATTKVISSLVIFIAGAILTIYFT